MQIIVASNNLFRRELSSFILSEAGYIVHEANDSATLLRYLEHMHPDLILLDERLGWPKNQDITHYIRQHNMPVPIMLITSNSSLPESVSIASNYDEHVTWPYQAEDLLSQVGTVLRRCSSGSGFSTLSSA